VLGNSSRQSVTPPPTDLYTCTAATLLLFSLHLQTGLSQTMRAMRVHKFGGPEVLRYDTDVPIPKPGPTDVLIRVKAVGINPVETYIRSGSYARLPSLPAILGNDCAGIVEQTGSEVIRFKAGDRVFASKSSTGAYAEYTVSPAASVHGLPASLSFSQGAALPVPYLTAYRALFVRGSARPGRPSWSMVRAAGSAWPRSSLPGRGD
jgi:NADPH2:quinone reductase